MSASGCWPYLVIFVVKYVLPSILTRSVHMRVSSRHTPGFAPGFIGMACTPLCASAFGRALSANAARFLISMSLVHSSPSRVLPGPSIILTLTCMDPFRAWTSGNRWIVVTIGHLTLYPETGALPAATTRDIASFPLKNFILCHGAPRKLLSDRECVFLFEVVNMLLAECRIIHCTTTAYHP